MRCYRCSASPVLFQRYSGRHLCAEHLAADIESRAKRVIRQYRWLGRDDRIGMVRGMNHSPALEIFLTHLIEGRKDIVLISLESPSPEKPYSEEWMQDVNRIGKISSCTKIALPTSAEDLAEEILSGIFQGDLRLLLGCRENLCEIPCIEPFREIPAGELDLYQKFREDVIICGHENPLSAPPASCRTDIREFLEDYTFHHPSAPHALRRYRDQIRELESNPYFTRSRK